MNSIKTKEYLKLREIFPTASICDNLSSMEDGEYDVWLSEADGSDLEYADSNAFFLRDMKAKDGFIHLRFGKYPDCRICGKLEREHNAQRTGNYCPEKYQPCQMTCRLDHRHISVVFTPETDSERIDKYKSQHDGGFK